ncbi:hypothetical protein BD408DRAFT_413428 [Parasitella parasitica]|nr:hypothetical protein BD408DRAFT_413428 [Parasitella parasitica]
MKQFIRIRRNLCFTTSHLQRKKKGKYRHHFYKDKQENKTDYRHTHQHRYKIYRQSYRCLHHHHHYHHQHQHHMWKGTRMAILRRIFGRPKKTCMTTMTTMEEKTMKMSI